MHDLCTPSMGRALSAWKKCMTSQQNTGWPGQMFAI